jgi:uncharacterized protein
MKPRVNVVTLGVENFAASLNFYRDGLGFPTQGEVTEDDPIAFFDLQSGLILALFRRSELAHDAGVPMSAPASANFTLGHFVHSREEVDAVMAQAQEIGAKITDPAHDRPWGIYSGYFQDPDGHLWEIIWNPEIDMSAID